MSIPFGFSVCELAPVVGLPGSNRNSRSSAAACTRAASIVRTAGCGLTPPRPVSTVMPSRSTSSRALRSVARVSTSNSNDRTVAVLSVPARRAAGASRCHSSAANAVRCVGIASRRALSRAVFTFWACEIKLLGSGRSQAKVPSSGRRLPGQVSTAPPALCRFASCVLRPWHDAHRSSTLLSSSGAPPSASSTM